MDKVDNLLMTVQHEVADYVRSSPNATAFFVENAEQHVFAVLSVPTKDPQKTSVVVMARVIDNLVLIESDKTNKPLVEALLQAGVPREQIVLVYEGEHIPAA
ncbi:MAG: XisI protein [Anaerolineae bacterium]|nr:XisI protein [Anaerolineae bacterium]